MKVWVRNEKKMFLSFNFPQFWEVLKPRFVTYEFQGEYRTLDNLRGYSINILKETAFYIECFII